MCVCFLFLCASVFYSSGCNHISGWPCSQWWWAGDRWRNYRTYHESIFIAVAASIIFVARCLKKDGSLLNHPYLELTNYCAISCSLLKLCFGVNFLYNVQCTRICMCEHVVSLGLSLCANFLQFCCVSGVYVKTRLCWGDVRPFLYHFVCLFCFWTGWVGSGCR